MSETIKLAGGVLLNADNEMLLLHRRTETLAQWEMPGGKIEDGEDPVAAVHRELRAEIGVEVTRARFLAQTAFKQASKDYEYHWFQVATLDRPQIMEPQTFDEMNYVALFRLRRMTAVLSPNMQSFSKQLSDGEIRLET